MHISDLLVDIKLDIFTRLPAQDILSCKQVCKPWESLLSNPSFAGLHLKKQKQLLDENDDQKVSLDFLFMIKFDESDQENQLWLSKYAKNSYTTTKLINQLHPPINMNSIVGSSNGLICMSLSETPYGMYDPVYICNPVTREYVNLPRYTDSWYGLIYSGFGYVDSTNEYKVVRIFYGQNKSVGNVQVYTLGDGIGWRNKQDLNRCFQYNVSITRGLFLDGAIHWLDEEMNIVIFNLADEMFYQIPSQGQDFCCNFVVLGGCLCVVDYDQQGGPMKLLLFIKNREELGDKQLGIWTECAVLGSYSWSYCPFSLTKSSQVLIWCKEDGLCIYSYDPKTANTVRLASHPGLTDFEAISHINSFVSLKALGEDAKVI